MWAHALAGAVKRIQDQDIEVLAALVAQEVKAFEKSDKRRRLALSGEFHSRLAHRLNEAL